MKIDIFLIVIGLMFILVSGAYLFNKMKSREGWQGDALTFSVDDRTVIITDTTNPPNFFGPAYETTSKYHYLYSGPYNIQDYLSGKNRPETNLHCDRAMKEGEYIRSQAGRETGLVSTSGGWAYCTTDSEYKRMKSIENAAAETAATVYKTETDGYRNIVIANIKTITDSITPLKNKYDAIKTLNDEIDTKTSDTDKTNSCSILAENQLKILAAAELLKNLGDKVKDFKIDTQSKYRSLQNVITYLNTKLPYKFTSSEPKKITCLDANKEPKLTISKGVNDDKEIVLQLELPGTDTGIRGPIGKYGNKGQQGDIGQQGDGGVSGYWGSV